MHPINESVKGVLSEFQCLTEEVRRIVYQEAEEPEHYASAAELVNGGGQMSIQVSGQYIRDHAVATFIALDGDKVVGTASIKDGDDMPEMAEVGYTAVTPQYQRQGVAQRLTRMREQKASQMGIDVLYASVRATQHSSRNNLAKAGFIHAGTRQSPWSSNMLAYYVKGIGISDDEATETIRNKYDLEEE